MWQHISSMATQVVAQTFLVALYFIFYIKRIKNLNQVLLKLAQNTLHATYNYYLNSTMYIFIYNTNSTIQLDVLHRVVTAMFLMATLLHDYYERYDLIPGLLAARIKLLPDRV